METPTFLNKKGRSALAKHTINTIVPQILSSNPRALAGVRNSRLVRYDPSLVPSKKKAAAASSPALPGENTGEEPGASTLAPPPTSSPPPSPPRISVIKSDTFDAVHSIITAATSDHVRRDSPIRVAALNMCSPLRPGGGVLNGALAQEESLCVRSTLYASLHESYYRLPEGAAVYSPDVLVFRSSSATTPAPAPKAGWFFCDVISCAALRKPDVMRGGDGAGTEERVYVYESESAREAMTARVRLVLQVAAREGVTHLVLGAWGCGAYGNPPGEVARMFKRVLCGGRRGAGISVAETGIEEVVFAIFDEGENLRTFREVLGDGVLGAS